MAHCYKIASAALVLFLAFASPAATAPGPLEAILSAPFEIGESLVKAALSFPDSLTGQRHRVRRAVRHGVQHARYRKRRQPAYRFKEPVEHF